uniref:Endothelin-3 n=1 Tax=Periophthalmus magnuspinnatus TaxID=409849 RepID=A0A3B4A2T4_9GOBI
FSVVVCFSVLVSFSVVVLFSVSVSGAIPNDRPTGFGGSEDLGMSRIKDAKPRLKRCTCYSYMDRECVYYCHLDIIWVNTPERTVPYGMSSYQAPQRMRRETVESPRCLCAVADADQQCRDFCQSRLVIHVTAQRRFLLSMVSCIY